nr:hypothetical protein [Euryarchaeota archaeon]
MGKRVYALLVFSLLLLSIIPVFGLDTPDQEVRGSMDYESIDDLSPSQISAIDIFKAEIYASGRSSHQTNASWVIDSAVSAGGTSSDEVFGIALDSSGNAYLTGYFRYSADFGNNIHLTSTSTDDIFVAKLSPIGNWMWAYSLLNETGGGSGKDIVVDSSGYIYVTGQYSGGVNGCSSSFSSGTHPAAFVAKIDSSFLLNAQTGGGIWIAKMNQNGTWLWAKWAGNSNSNNHGTNIVLDGNGLVMISGQYVSSGIFGQYTLPGDGNGNAFIAGLTESGFWLWAQHIGIIGQTEDSMGLALLNNGEAVVTGNFVESQTIGSTNIFKIGNGDFYVASMSTDYDGDGLGHRTDSDDDGDLIPDAQDSCPFSEIGFMSVSTNDHDSDGCRDSDNDNDDDNDGVEDAIDSCPKGIVGWTPTSSNDFDSDGCSDALEDTDDDNDGVEDYLDLCPREEGNSTFEFEEGCPDSDGDGSPDIKDRFVNNSNEWSDIDYDGTGDNADEFDTDASQQTDADGDGHGDNPYGTEGDWFPDDPERWADSDRDGVADEDDAFPNDATQWNDTDGDGHGDEMAGNQGDAFPNDPEEWQDSDSDGVGNNADAFPFDPSQQTDSDGDGFGDNPLGSGADKFPDDPSQWSDIDGDGFGDNQTGTDADVFIADPTQHADRDGDGYGDSLSGRLADMFPDNPTQWIDQDGDGLGDNQSGTDADPYLFDFDNDGYNDSIDILPKLASPGDHDNDGCLDEVDAFPLDYRECSDFDGDGEGDNADTDDDNDGWTDTDEIREDTDPFDASDYPIVAFQLMIPGTTIGLDGWDLIGIFGG